MTSQKSILKFSRALLPVLVVTTPLEAQEGFAFTWDPSPSAEQDRLLHAAIGYQTSQVVGAITDRPWLGALSGFAVQLPKEISDGLSNERDFCIPDLFAGALGGGLPWLRHAVPALDPLALKVCYWPSNEYRNRTDRDPTLTSDYAGQRYFLSYAPGLLPAAPARWPRWLAVAVGHGTSNWVATEARHRWFITLDLAARALPGRNRVWRAILAGLDQIHFPLPGIEISRGEVKLGLY